VLLAGHQFDEVDGARLAGVWDRGQRPVGDIDVLILGEPDRDQLYAALSDAEERLGRPVQAMIRGTDWVDTGSGAFHNTVTSRPLLKLPSNGAC
jgi:hypothetical protein